MIWVLTGACSSQRVIPEPLEPLIDRSVSFQEIVDAPEFDLEIAAVAITLGIQAQLDADEFDLEIQSVRVNRNINAVEVEFEREFGSTEISRVLVPGAGEFDFEADEINVTAQTIFEGNAIRLREGFPVPVLQYRSAGGGIRP